MFMDSEPSVIFDRGLLGEPKKLARAYLQSAVDSGGGVHGWVERHGVRLIELSAQLGEDTGRAPDPHLLSHPGIEPADRTGAMVMRSTPHDPCGELPVLEVVDLPGFATPGSLSSWRSALCSGSRTA